MAENVTNSGRGTNIQVQETQKVPNKMNPKRTTSRHFIITVIKIKGKEKNLYPSRQKNKVRQKKRIRLSLELYFDNTAN